LHYNKINIHFGALGVGQLVK